MTPLKNTISGEPERKPVHYAPPQPWRPTGKGGNLLQIVFCGTLLGVTVLGLLVVAATLVRGIVLLMQGRVY